MSANRFRIRQVFWIDLNKPEEYDLAEKINILKQKRAFAKTIRDGIRLIWDLSQGKTDVLRELFPWVLEQTQTGDTKKKFATLPPDNTIQKHLERLEQLLLDNQKAETPPAHRIIQPSSDAPPELEIKQAKSDENAAYNMILSGVALGITHPEDLPSEIIEYGIKKGRLPESARKKSKGPKPLAIPKIDFSPPPLDDLDLSLG